MVGTGTAKSMICAMGGMKSTAKLVSGPVCTDSCVNPCVFLGVYTFVCTCVYVNLSIYAWLQMLLCVYLCEYASM